MRHSARHDITSDGSSTARRIAGEVRNSSRDERTPQGPPRGLGTCRHVGDSGHEAGRSNSRMSGRGGYRVARRVDPRSSVAAPRFSRRTRRRPETGPPAGHHRSPIRGTGGADSYAPRHGRKATSSRKPRVDTFRSCAASRPHGSGRRPGRCLADGGRRRRQESGTSASRSLPGFAGSSGGPASLRTRRTGDRISYGDTPPTFLDGPRPNRIPGPVPDTGAAISLGLRLPGPHGRGGIRRSRPPQRIPTCRRCEEMESSPRCRMDRDHRDRDTFLPSAG